MFQILGRYGADSEHTHRGFEWNPPSIPVDESDPTDRELSDRSVRRSRPLTLIQEALFFAAVFVIGGALQALVLLNIASVVE